MSELVIFGASGHAKVVIDILRKGKARSIAGVVDSALPNGSSFFGLPVLGNDEELPHLVARGLRAGIVAIGDNFLRSQVVERVLKVYPEFEFVSAIHPSAVIGEGVEIGHGSVVTAGVVINPDTRIGKHAIVNTGALIDHDNLLGNFVTVAPGSVTGGNVKMGDFSVLSLGARVIHGLSIGRGAVVGAGAVVVMDVPELVVAYGIPARVVRTRRIEDRYLR